MGAPIMARDIPGNRSLLDLIHGAAKHPGAATTSAAVTTTASSSVCFSSDCSSARSPAAAATTSSSTVAAADPASFAKVSYGNSGSRDSRDSRGSVLALDSYEVHPCGVLCPTPESLAAAIVDALTPGASGIAAAVYAAAERARAGAEGLAAFERSTWTEMVLEVAGPRCRAATGSLAAK